MKRLAAMFTTTTLRCLAALLLAIGAGCGPGVGGTGTGEAGEFFADFGAAPAPVCGAPFASRLECAEPQQPGGPVSAGGTVPLAFVDVAGGRVSVVFSGNGAALDAPCAGLEFDGAWGTAPGSGERFYGGLLERPDEPRVPASLSVVALGDGSRLRVELRRADGTPVLGPLTLAPQAPPVAPPACP